MPTAPSFQTMLIVSEIYLKNKKSYIDVKNEKTGTIRSVRWYSDTEYKRLYGKAEPQPKINPGTPIFFKSPYVKELKIEEDDGKKTLTATVYCEGKVGEALMWSNYGALKQEERNREK